MSKLLPRVLVLAFLLIFAFPLSNLAASFSGAVYTTDSSCSGADLNIYASKDQVYLNGGPSHPGSAGLPDGEYYVRVTEPNGTLLGTSVGTGDETPAVVVDGEFVSCYQLSTILIKASDASGGYDTSGNDGGEYKVWVSSSSNFESSFSKTDNFKVDTSNNGGEDPDPESGTLNVVKFYDANANGLNDDGIEIPGWLVRIQDGVDYYRYTPISMVLAPDVYTVTEQMPVEPNWSTTTQNPVSVTLDNGDNQTVEFGNLCTGAGGGHTLGYWSNKNGQKNIDSADLAMLTGLNLKNEDGSNFDPASYSILRFWLLKARAVNMANMLSAQLAAMELNVYNGFVNGNALVYAPGSTSANSLGYTTINALMAEANAELASHPITVSSGTSRTYQAGLKDALDNANNNTNFVQSTPCPFTFSL